MLNTIRLTGDVFLTKRIKFVSILIILAIIIGACCAVVTVEGKTIQNVSGFSMTDSSESSINLQWEKAKGADGYRIYIKDNKDGSYKKFKNIKNGDVCEYSLNGINFVKKYDLKMTAYKIFRDKEYESEMSRNITVYSKPHKINVSSFSSNEKTLSIKWKTAEAVDGFEIEYSKDESFSNCETADITDVSKQFMAVENLRAKDIYYTRGRSYINAENKKVYSDWSDTGKVEIKDKIKMPVDIDPNKKMVALSFDDGPAYKYNGKNSTEQILKVLEKHDARASFFMVADRINDSNSYLLKKELKIGCELGNHTISHNHYGSKVTASDIKKASDRIKKFSGQPSAIFRCPGGSLTSEIRNECKKEGMPIAYWSVDTEDWKTKDPDKIYKTAMKGVYDGAIILMHDIYPTTAKAVEKLVPALIEKGYQIVTVSELITAKTGKEPKAGQQYVDYKTINNNT